MDVSQIRHKNLLHVLRLLAGRGITRNQDAAQQLGGLGESYLSQLKGGKKMGDDTARKIDAALRHKAGWMDGPQWGADEETEASAPKQRGRHHVSDGDKAIYNVARTENRPPQTSLEFNHELFLKAAEMVERAMSAASARKVPPLVIGRAMTVVYLHLVAKSSPKQITEVLSGTLFAVDP